MRNKRVGEWLVDTRRRLTGSQQSPDKQDTGLDAQLLLSSVLGKSRAWVIAHPDAEIDLEQDDRLEGLLEKLTAGVPLPYLLGHWEFYGLDFQVSPAVLIPRPETELLVEHAIDWLSCHPDRRKAADAGTGSGCIAVSIARQFADLQLLAVDRSWSALQVAQRNIQRHGVSQRVRLVQSDLLSAAAGPFDLVCANLPYIPSPVLAELSVARYEPILALDGGQNGLATIEALITDAPRWLAPGGLILLEMQFDQGKAVQQVIENTFCRVETKTYTDLAGLPRLIALQDTRST